MADVTSDAIFTCFKCEKTFTSNKALSEHLKRKRKGKLVGCSKQTTARNSETASVSNATTVNSPALTPVSGSTPSDIEQYDTHGDEDVAKEETMTHITTSFDIHKIKKMHMIVVSKSPSDDYLIGTAHTAVMEIMQTSEYKSDPTDANIVKKIMKRRKKNDQILQSAVMTAEDIQKKGDDIFKCTQTCDYIQRRIRRHKLQMYIGMHIIRSCAVTKSHWRDFVIGHIKGLRGRCGLTLGNILDNLDMRFPDMPNEIQNFEEQTKCMTGDDLNHAHSHRPTTRSTLNSVRTILQADIDKYSSRRKRRRGH